MSNSYQSEDIEVLTGLDPVRRRPGMYTDTTRPNHLIQEVVDNSVDEALAGYARTISVTLDKGGFIEVMDDGRGMPVDIHPEEGVPGVELILTRLHAGGKFSNDNYRFSGGLHGVGVSVVNALSATLEVSVRREGELHRMTFANGEKETDLSVIDTVGKRNTGTTIRFQPDPSYFDSASVSISRLAHLLRAKAVLCPGLRMILVDNINNGDKKCSAEWYFEDGLSDYLHQSTAEHETLPSPPFVGGIAGNDEAVDWAVQWLPEGGPVVTESYVNLVPTVQGGTHVNGFRSGLLEALREFCEFRNLLPRGIKLTSDDLWERCSYVLSVKLLDPQFAGQTKERLSSREASSFILGVLKDAFSLWLNKNTDDAEALAELAISNAQTRLRKAKTVARKKITQGPALPGKLADCSSQDSARSELFL